MRQARKGVLGLMIRGGLKKRTVLVEWVVRNTKINVRPGTTAVVRTMPFRVDPAVLQAHVDKPLGSWTRVVLSRVNIKAKAWDGSGIWPHGEVEDLRFGGQNASPFAQFPPARRGNPKGRR